MAGAVVLLAAWSAARADTGAPRTASGTTAPVSAEVAGSSQAIRIQVAIPNGLSYHRIRVELTRLGQQKVIELLDDGTLTGDRAWDGVFMGEDIGPYARYVNVRLVGVRPDGEEDVLFAGPVRTSDRREVLLAWRIERWRNEESDAANPKWTALRVAPAWTGTDAAEVGLLPVVVAFGWGIFLLVYISRLVALRRSRP